MAEEKAPSLEQEEPLTEEDIRYFIRAEIMERITSSRERGLGQVIARFALEQIRAVNRFEKSSSLLSRCLYWLTWLLVFRQGTALAVPSESRREGGFSR